MPSFSDWLEYISLAPELSPGKDYHVGITFRPEARPWVLLLKESLQYAGFLVHLDQVSTPLETPLRNALDRGLDRCESGALVLGDSDRGSLWRRIEHETMMRAVQENGCQYVPILRADEDSSTGGRLDGDGDFRGSENGSPEFESRSPVDFSGFSRCPHGEGLVRLSYRVLGEEAPPKALDFARNVDRDLENAMLEVDALRRGGTRRELVAMAESESMAWSSFPVLRCRTAEVLCEKGGFDDALIVLDRVHQEHPLNVRCRQLRGWILSRQGNAEEALLIHSGLEGEGPDDPSTLEFLARYWIDRYHHTGETRELRNARSYVLAVLRSQPDRASSLGLGGLVSVLLQEFEIARVYAGRVLACFEGGVPQGLPGSSVLAEASLILGRVDDAAQHLETALGCPPSFPCTGGSVAFEVGELLEALPVPAVGRDRIRRILVDRDLG